MKRTAALLLLAACVVPACSTSPGVDRALVEAGRLRRHEQPPPTAAELRLEVGSVLETELPLLRKRAAQALGREARRWRAVSLGGAALGVLAATSGSVASAGGSTKPVLVSLGAAGAIGGGVAFAVRSREPRACVAALDAAAEDLASFRERGIPPGDGVVAEAVWHAWVDRLAAVRGHPACAKLR